jgi:pyruvate,water dikinase
MIPFCRTPEEGKAVLAVMGEAGLKRGKDGLKVYVMVEIPSNVILADGFAEVFDGFSIGSNDLTQLTLGVDRDSELVAHLYDEMNKAVMASVRQVIKAAKKNGVKIGICGQAPSDSRSSSSARASTAPRSIPTRSSRPRWRSASSRRSSADEASPA